MKTTVRVHYDAGWNNQLFLRGDIPGLNWDKGREMEWRDGNVWVLDLKCEHEGEFKVLINDREWSIGRNYHLEPGQRRNIYPHFWRKQGRLDVVYHFDTPIIIYLPPSYDENPFKHYPTIYMHDGQNLFDPATAFGGQVWAVDKTINRLVNEGLMDEVIAVGIYNRGAARIHDFTPTHDPEFMGVGAGGGALNYLNLIVDEIMPFIDTHYRTQTRRESTALLGSSLGGLVSVFMARERPDVFSKVGALSSSFWWNRRNFIERVIRKNLYLPLKIYLDAGSHDNEKETLQMYRVLQDIGHKPGEDVFCHIASRHAHSERYWAQRVHLPLRFLFPFDGIHEPHLWKEEPLVQETKMDEMAAGWEDIKDDENKVADTTS